VTLVTLKSVNSRAPESRQARKQRTRDELLRAALRLLEDQSFSGLSLREVAREAGVVPTAFYRHFDNMEELGLALIDESFRTLREMIRAARADPSTFEHVIPNSVDILVRHVHENRLHFRFIARERFSGVASLRHAIRAEIRLFASELATDLVRFPYMQEWSSEDLHVMAGLLVNAMVSIVEALLDAPANSAAAEREIRRIAEKQLRMVVLAAPAWRSRPSSEG
jgi:AcrR family transcriptional regulator